MLLEGRNLQLNLRGADVERLRGELIRLGFNITDPPAFFGSTTFTAVQRFQTNHQIPATGIVDARTARAINQAIDALPRQTWRVQGRLLQPDGLAVPNARVRVFEKRLRRDAVLGEAAPDRTGQYGVDYPVPAAGDISIHAQAFAADGARIAASELICHANPVETVDLVAGDAVLRGRPLFASLQAQLRPLLATDEVVAADLSGGDVHWLACRHGLDEAQLARFADAARLAREAELPREHQAMFGLLMQNMPPVLDALIAQSARSLRAALLRSVADNEVDAALEPRIGSIIEALQGVIVRLALRDPTPDRPSFALLFELAGTPRAHREAVITDHLRRTGTPAEFWDAQQRRLGAAATTELQHVIRLAALSLNHEPLLRELMRMRAAGEAGRTIEDLARLDRDDWLRLIRRRVGNRPIGAPAMLGSEEAARDNLFATYLARFVEAQAPTRVLAERLASDTPAQLVSGRAFLLRAPAFDFRRDRVDDFLRTNPDALDGDADRAATRAALKTMQRLFDLAPPFDKHRTVRLAGQGIESATQIRRMGETAFVERTRSLLGDEATARTVYSKAAQKADTALLLLSQTTLVNSTPLAVLPPQVLGPGIPDLEDLFGSLDACQCLHCASVYSPAAYLVDILHFLMNRHSATPGRSALDVLFERRPDIGEVDLTCDNTHVTLPYVDLVVEILENAVAPGGGFPFQTEGEAADLLASPAHVNTAAYDAGHLAGAVYPWSLPFDLWTEVGRAYLEHLGVPRHELMLRFRARQDSARDADVAAELLGLTTTDRSALVDGTPGARRGFWGFDDAASFNQFAQARNVGTVLTRGRMTYDELTAALAVRFVDPAGNLRVEFAGADCNIDTATIVNLDTPALDRLHRFMRLHRRLGWRIEELGALLQTLGIAALNNAALIRISDVKRLQRMLGAPLRSVLGWWAPLMDTAGIGAETSLYDAVFLDPSASSPVPDVFRLNAGRNELEQADMALISANLPQVHAALGVSAIELDLLRPDLPNDRLNLQNLTRLQATVSLAKVLGLKVADFLTLRALTGINPAGPAAATSATMRLVEIARDASLAGRSLALIDYLLRHRFVANASHAMSDDEIAGHLGRLRDDLRAIDAGFALAPAGVDTDASDFEADPDGTRTATHLAALLPADAVNRALALIRQDAAHAPADAEAFVQQHFAAFLDPAEAIARLVNPGTLSSERDRFNYLLGRLLAHRRSAAREAEAVASIAGSIAIDPALAEALLRELVRSPADPQRSVITDLVADAFVGAFGEPSLPQIERQILPNQFAGYERLHKLAQAVGLFGLDEVQVRFVIQQGPQRGWPDIAALPLVATDQTGFDAFLTMARALDAGAALPGGLTDFFALLRWQDEPGLSRSDYLDEVALRTGWDRASIEFIAGGQLLDLSWPLDFRSGVFLAEMLPRVLLLRRLGATAATAQSWSAATVPFAASQTIVQTARAKYPDKGAWLAVARPLRDPLRERQRASLVDHLVHRHGLRSANDLYGHYLVDVEMSPCMLTSRLVLATASVQLFVQRCLLNLEADVPPSAIDTQQWEWMKNYRVWEANRKIFLYPENWIEPELRDDKSPLFLALEQGLLQDDITAATVEREYRKYLEALDQVANLEIAAMCIAPAGREKDVVHVFARTRNSPRHYFYRRWNRATWTVWESLGVDIEGNHLVPLVWNRHLTLLWPVFLDKAVEVEPESVEEEPAKPQKYYDISLAWTELREGRWSPKRTSKQAIESGIPFRLHEPWQHHSLVSAKADDGTIEIGVLLRWPGEKSAEFVFAQVFHLTGIGDVETVSAGTRSLDKAWPTGRLFPSTSLYGNDLREKSGHVGFSAHTTSTSTIAAHTAVSVLGRSPGRFRIVFPESERPFFCRLPFFYQDQAHAFFVEPDGRYLRDPNSGSPLADDLVGVAPPPTGASPAPRGLALIDLPVRMAAFHAEVAVRALAGTAPSASSASTNAMLPGHWETTSLRFSGHHHPFVRLLLEQLNRFGIAGLLRPTAAMEPAVAGAFESLRRQQLHRPYFWDEYEPNPDVVENVPDFAPGLLGQVQNIALIRAMLPREEFDFSFAGAYSIYNWELFFHAPLMIAKRLSANRRFEEAHRWYGYIFDPTDPPSGGDPQSQAMAERAWNLKPFVEHGRGRSIERLMLLLQGPGLSKQQKEQRNELKQQIKAWRANPFNPHLIARMRVQPYMMAVVMAYLDNLIAWGDELFRRDTMESVNEASQLYILAAEVLGDRPREIAAHEDTRHMLDGQPVRNFNDLRDHLDDFSNVLIELETIIHPGEADQGAANSGGLLHVNDFAASTAPNAGFALDLDFAAPVPAVVGATLFFCIPRNDRLVGYWDIVADRLFKIRHCMNIEGVVRQLPLFQPPIDPALLVRAAAAGIDISSVLSDLLAPLPRYRFMTLLQRARDMTSSVKALGGALLSALEKKDGEELSLLRARHESDLLDAVRATKQKNIEEAGKNLAALEESRKLAAFRMDFYATRERTNAKEDLQQKKLENAFALQTTSQALELLAGALALIPQFNAGISGAFGSPVVVIEIGGFQLSTAIQVASRALQLAASVESYRGNKASLEAGYDRRQEDWTFQANSAELEIDQLDKQIEASKIRIELAELELDNHALQIANSQAVAAYLTGKYTNQALYAWTLGQLSTLHFQTHQLALDLAKCAERCFHFELGIQQSGFVSNGHWDSLRKGLLAGEKLELDLQRMEAAYFDQNRREYELTKHVSLRQLSPLALLTLKATGACEFDLPEWLFDLDGPGHFLRRIRNVSISLPCVVGPYASVNCTASLLNSSVRHSALLAGGYARVGEDTSRFTDDFGTVQSVVTSTASNDSGLFETNLRDERYLPFEGSGAIGRWRLELPRQFRQFDYNTITDVVMHVRYTAREGGTQLRDAAVASLSGVLTTANDHAPMLLVSLRNDYPGEWNRFVNGDALSISIGRERFSYITQGRTISVDAIGLVALTGSTPVPAALTVAEIGLDELPVFGPGQQSAAELRFSDALTQLERSLDAYAFLLVSYTIQ